MYNMSAVWLSLVAFLSTCAGGLFALRFRDRLHFILSFTAGVLLGVVSFDILPEIFELARKGGLMSLGRCLRSSLGF
jgi:zinc transporter ZupT